jgi:hypothetical protein
MDRSRKFRWEEGDIEILHRAEPPHYGDLVDLSLASYAAHLEDLLRSNPFQTAAEGAVVRLRDLLITAQQKRLELQPWDFEFVASDLTALNPNELQLLHNAWCLGSFNDGARVVFMGTEEGRPSKDVGQLALGNFGYGVSWATGGKPSILSKISGLPVERFYHNVYHRHPYTYNRASTWNGMARCLASNSGRETSSFLKDDEGLSRLGDLSYLIDRSSAPSPSARSGLPPTPTREAFLHAVVSALAASAHVLVLTGSTGRSASPDWLRINEKLTHWFLGTDTPSRPAVEDTRLQVFDTPNRRVIWSWALGGRARLESRYFQTLGSLVREVPAV